MRTYTILTFLFTALGFMLIGPSVAHGAERIGTAVTLPISATLLQCGKRAELQNSCNKDSRCCAFLGAQEGNISLTDNNSAQTTVYTR